MPYFTIKEILKKLDSNTILLPAMQRKYVWKEEQIISFFDSILSGYPFGNFIFWHINDESISEYCFYKFIKDYSYEGKKINEKARPHSAEEEVDVVLDGQQRLTSLYLGILGSIKNIDKYKRRNKAENWKKKHLYIRPYIEHSERNDDDKQYKFEFLEDSTAKEWNKNHSKDKGNSYYKIIDLYRMSSKEELCKWLNITDTDENEWSNILELLRFKINEDKIINVDLIQDFSISEVLEIFTRINNGGTHLSPANILFSTVITSWPEGRDEIDEFISTINKSHVMHIKEDFLIRSCVYLVDEPLSAKNGIIKKSTVGKIKKKWDDIKKAILKTKDLLEKNKIYNSAILSYNSLMPIFYYYFHMKPSKVANEELIRFFAISQMFSLFGGNSDKTLTDVRRAMCKDQILGKLKKPFKVEYLKGIDLSAGRNNAFKIEKQMIEKAVDSLEYGNKKTAVALCLLQPQILLKDCEYDVDHVVSKTEIKRLSKGRKSKADVNEMMNKLPNLQLLDYNSNRGIKNDDTIYEWIVKKGMTIPYEPFPNNREKYDLKSTDDFLDFYNARRELIVKNLCNRMGVDY